MSLIQEALRRQQEEQAAEKNSTGPTPAAAPKEPDTKSHPEDLDTPPAPEPETTKEIAPQRKLGLQSRASVAQDTPPAATQPAAPPAEEPPAAPPAEEPPAVPPPAAPPAVPPPAAPPAEEPPAEEPPVRVTPAKKEHRVLIPLLGILLVLILLGGIVAWSLMYGLRMFSKTNDLPALVAVEVIPPAEPTPPAEPDPAVVEIIADVPVVDDDPIDTTAGIEPDGDATVPEPDPEVLAPDPEPQEGITSLPPATTPPPPQEPAPPAVPVIWPEVIVSGVIGAGDTGSAIINGKVIGLNESIDDVTLRDVGRGFVVLEYQEATRQFNVGRPIR